MKNSILLISGLVVTLLFLIFSTSLFEALYYDREFSNEMYNQNLYFIVAIVTAVVVWVLAGIYYYAVNSVRFSCWYHWLIVLIAAMIIAPVINFTYPNNIFQMMVLTLAITVQPLRHGLVGRGRAVHRGFCSPSGGGHQTVATPGYQKRTSRSPPKEGEECLAKTKFRMGRL